MMFLKVHAKAVAGFISAEAGSFLVALQAEQTSAKLLVIAALTPLAVGAAVHRVPNQS